MVSAENFIAIQALDLEPIKQKLMNRKAGKGWTKGRVDAVEREYRRFLYLVKAFPDAPLAPAVDVDEFWHYHILDTRKYAADCEHIFGYFLHHFPYAGMRGKEDEQALMRVGARTGALYEQTFGDIYGANLAAVDAPARPALSVAVRLSAAYGRPAQPAYCYVTGATPAFCYSGNVQAAYCYATNEKPAYCYADAAQPALCEASDAKFYPDAKPAFCYTETKSAYCYATAAEEGVTGSDPFAASEGQANDVTAAVREKGFRRVDAAAGANAGRLRPPEERMGFYLERPRLASA